MNPNYNLNRVIHATISIKGEKGEREIGTWLIINMFISKSYEIIFFI